jgi:hypothetical protein
MCCAPCNNVNSSIIKYSSLITTRDSQLRIDHVSLALSSVPCFPFVNKLRAVLSAMPDLPASVARLLAVALNVPHLVTIVTPLLRTIRISPQCSLSALFSWVLFGALFKAPADSTVNKLLSNLYASTSNAR